MATVTKPIALDESFNTTEVTPRNIADVLAEGLSHITGRTASEVEYDNTDSGLTSDDVQGAIDELSERPTLPTTDIQTAVDEFSTYNGGLLSSLKVALTPNQDLHGYSEPWVGGAGKNKIPYTTQTSQTINGITFTINADGTVSANGTSTATATLVLHSSLGFTWNTDMILNGCPSGGSASTYDLRASTSSSEGVSYDYGSGATITLGTTINRVVILIRSGQTLNNVLFKPMISVSGGDFEPYSNICPISGHTQVDVDVSDGDTTQEQVTVNLGGTYYSGTLDVVTGVFVPDMAGVDLGTLTWTYEASWGASSDFYATINNALNVKRPDTNDDAANAICTQYKMVSRNEFYDSADSNIAILPTPYIKIRDSRYNDGTAFQSAMNGVMLVYELATPIIIQLSPTMVKALVGENNLSAPLEGQEITESKYKKMFTFDDVIAYIQSLS